jgi:hypothetical protein
MKIVRIAALVGLSMPASTVPGFAESCMQQMHDAHAAFAARLDAIAAAGPAATQTKQATLHHQPTPNSVAHAEATLGDISQRQADAFAEFMKRAKDADDSGDAAACARALQDAETSLKN